MTIFDTIRIDTPKLKIRSIDQTSWEKLADGLLYENSFHARNWNIKTHDDIKNLYEKCLKSWANRNSHPIVFLSPDESKVFGMTNFMNVEETHLMSEIGGTWIGKKWQRSFVNTTTKYELLKHLFENLNFKRVEFRIDIDNLISQKAIERIGAQFEGVLRNRRINATGNSRDYCFYSIIDKDWPLVKKSLIELIESYSKPYSNELKKIVDLRKEQKFEDAFEAIIALIKQYPNEGVLYYQAAWICDAGRTEQEAVTFYKKALEFGLNEADKKGALLGLGSTWRSLGNYYESESIFRQALEEFPDYKPFAVFNSLTSYNLKKYDKAIGSLLTTLVATTNDQEIRAYKSSLQYYSNKLDEVFK